MTTIKDVAAAAGVSFSTVSHVLNNSRPVSPEARSSVEAAIRQLNYVPSGVARSLKVRATSTVGLLIPNGINPYFAELARGVEDFYERNGYCVILCNSDDDLEKQSNYLRVLLEKRIDGLVIASAGGDRDLADTLGHLNIPVVIVDRDVAGVSADTVQIDHEAGARLAANHLIELGHRKIACISGPAAVGVSVQRIRGFRRALEEAGIAVRSDWIVEGDFSSPGGYGAAQLLLKDPPTAIFAGNDMMGLGVLRALAERGLKVPDDVAVIGFDNVELGQFFYPALSTVGHSVRQIGEIAARALLQRMSGEEKARPRRLTIAPALFMRESTGLCRSTRKANDAA